MIVPMKRLTLIALKQDEKSILLELQAVSAVQVIKTGDVSDSDAALMQAEGVVQRYNGALSLMKPYAKKPSLLNPKPEYSVDALEANLAPAAEISGEIEAADHKRAAIRAQVDKLHTEIELLTPWMELPTKLAEIRPTKSTALFAGRLKVDQLPRLSELDPLCAVEYYGGEKERALLILCPLDLRADVHELLKSLDWSDVNFPGKDCSASETIEEDYRQIKALQAETEEIEKELHRLGESRAVLANAADAAVIERDRVLANTLLQKTEAAFLLEGWVREDEVEKAENAVKNATDAYYFGIRDPEEDEVPPSVVKNNKFVKSFESVTNLYSRPAYGSIDGTPLMAPWYFLLFGMMLSDTGYGIVLALGCYFFIKKAKPAGMMGDLAHVIMWGGISTIVWGVLIGTFFGMDWNALFGLGDGGPFPLIVNPNTDPIMMLLLCFGLGLIHIVCGVCIKIYMCFRDGDWQAAVFDNISWLMIIFGLLIFAGGSMLFDAPALGTAGIVIALVGAAMVLFMKGRGKKNIAKRLVSGAGGLYDVTSYLSDVLSYARLFALGIATGVIGSVFNQLAGMLMSGGSFIVIKIVLVIVGIALLIGLHLFNIGINTLGTFVHCARLQYVEFYGKFYEIGGREFKPLGYKTRHTRVTN